ARTVESFEHTNNNFPENDLKTTFEGFRLLVKGDYKGKITPELENLVDEFQELDKTGSYKTEVIFLSLKKKPTCEKYIEMLKKDFPDVSVRFLDFEGIKKIYETRYLSLTDEPPENISFEILHECVQKKEGPHKSIVFSCDGKEVARIYNEHRERVLDRDLRYSLGVKSKAINKAILRTATDDNSSANFWYFNNGITIVCNNIDLTANEKHVKLTKPQIINGAQTTCALYEAFQTGELKKDVEVLVKAIEVSNKDFIETVTLYTNFQNPIKLRDLC
ncbi:unnamed protein product, partial [marine sediment metagenome]